MKIRNKQTRKIVDLIGIVRSFDAFNEFYLRLSDKDGRTYKVGFNSLAELNAEWEDYHEEPKEYWYIDTTEGAVVEHTQEMFELTDKERKEIGNYFETKEQAEQAVKKLKAWKRLKDRGFRFNGWNGTEIGSNISYISEVYYEGCTDDLDLLFGGEE